MLTARGYNAPRVEAPFVLEERIRAAASPTVDIVVRSETDIELVAACLDSACSMAGTTRDSIDQLGRRLSVCPGLVRLSQRRGESGVCWQWPATKVL